MASKKAVAAVTPFSNLHPCQCMNVVVIAQVLSVEPLSRKKPDMGFKLLLFDRSGDLPREQLFEKWKGGVYVHPSESKSDAERRNRDEMEMIVYRSMWREDFEPIDVKVGSVLEFQHITVEPFNERFPPESWQSSLHFKANDMMIVRHATSLPNNKPMDQEDYLRYAGLELQNLADIAGLDDRFRGREVDVREHWKKRSLLVRVEWIGPLMLARPPKRKSDTLRMIVSDHTSHKINVNLVGKVALDMNRRVYVDSGDRDHVEVGSIVLLHRVQWDNGTWGGVITGGDWGPSVVSSSGFKRNRLCKNACEEMEAWDRRTALDSTLLKPLFTSDLSRITPVYTRISDLSDLIGEMHDYRTRDRQKQRFYEFPCQVRFTLKHALTRPTCSQCYCGVNFIPELDKWCCTNGKVGTPPSIPGLSFEEQKRRKHTGHLSSVFRMQYNASVQLRPSYEDQNAEFELEDEDTYVDEEYEDYKRSWEEYNKEKESAAAAVVGEKRKRKDGGEAPCNKRRKHGDEDTAMNVEHDKKTRMALHTMRTRAFDEATESLLGVSAEEWVVKTIDEQAQILKSAELNGPWVLRVRASWDEVKTSLMHIGVLETVCSQKQQVEVSAADAAATVS